MGIPDVDIFYKCPHKTLYKWDSFCVPPPRECLSLNRQRHWYSFVRSSTSFSTESCFYIGILGIVVQHALSTPVKYFKARLDFRETRNRQNFSGTTCIHLISTPIVFITDLVTTERKIAIDTSLFALLSFLLPSWLSWAKIKIVWPFVVRVGTFFCCGDVLQSRPSMRHHLWQPWRLKLQTFCSKIIFSSKLLIQPVKISPNQHSSLSLCRSKIHPDFVIYPDFVSKCVVHVVYRLPFPHPPNNAFRCLIRVSKKTLLKRTSNTGSSKMISKKTLNHFTSKWESFETSHSESNMNRLLFAYEYLMKHCWLVDSTASAAFSLCFTFPRLAAHKASP